MANKLSRGQIAGMNLIYKWHSFEYFLDSMEELGLSAISIWGGPPHFDCDYISYQDCVKLRRDVEGRGLSILCFLVTGSNYRYQIAEEEPEQREHMFQYFKNGILACEELGVPCMTISSGWGYWNHDREEAFKRAADMIRRLCEEGQAHGVTVAMESLKSCETNLVVTLEDTIRMEREVNHPGFRILGDTGAIAYNKERLEDWFAAFGDKICTMHFVDGMHLTWGDGKSPLDDMMMTMIRHNYKGCLSLETSGSRYFTNPREADRKALKILEPFVE